jgi:opacity protein-like surface antigen
MEYKRQRAGGEAPNDSPYTEGMFRWPIFVLALAVPALAQVGEFSISGGASRFSGNIGTIAETGGGEIEMTSGFRLGLRFTVNPREFFGHEFGYAYNRSKLRVDAPGGEEINVPVHQFGYNFLLYATPEGSRVRPFGTVGANFSSFFPPGASVYYGNQETKFGVNYGGGIKARVTEVWGIRLDLRQFLMPKPFDFPNQSGWLRQVEVSGGVSFLF